MLTDKQKIENVLSLFLNWNIGDVRKAAHLLPNSWESMDRDKITKIYPTYDGGAMVGAVILAMCVIQSVSQFSKREEQFKWFVNKYLKSYNSGYDGNKIYALRCSLIKNYALITRTSEEGKKNLNPIIAPFALTDNGPHFEKSKYGTLFNIREFVIHIQLGIQAFFVEVVTKQLPKDYSERIIKYHDTMKIGPINSSE